jgi:hypothetical protein
VELPADALDISSKVTVETEVIVVVVVWKMTVGQMLDSVDVDVGVGRDGDGNVVKVPSFVDVGTDPELLSFVDVWTAVDAVGEELPVTMQEQAEEIRVGSYWH